MIKSIIHAGGKSTRLREIYNGPKALAPIDNQPLLWFHLQPLIKSKLISKYIFTLRHQCDTVREYLDKLKNEFKISISSVIEPRPLGRAGSVRMGIEKGIINIDEPCLMSNPDDLIPININHLMEYASEAESKGKSLILVMAKKAMNPFGIGITKKAGKIIELKDFQEKPELPFIEGYYAHTGMDLFLPESMKEFLKVPLDRVTNPEDEIIPKLMKQDKVAVFL